MEKICGIENEMFIKKGDEFKEVFLSIKMHTFSIFGPTIYHTDGTAGAGQSNTPDNTISIIGRYLSNILQYISHFLDVISGEDEVVTLDTTGQGETGTRESRRDPESAVFYFDDDSFTRSGVSVAQLNQHTTLEYLGSEEDPFDCTICQEAVQSGIYRKINSCGHRFHVQCIDSWLDQHTTCPVCRQEIVPGSSSQRSLRNILYHLRSSIQLSPPAT